MSGMCGWFGNAGDAASGSALIASMHQALNKNLDGTTRTVVADHGGVATASIGPDSDLIKTDTLIVAVCGNARFTDAECDAAARRHGIAQALANAYLTKGTGILSSLTGHFVIAVLDGAARECLLAVDRIGTKPLYYAQARGQMVFASRLDTIARHPAVQSRVNPQAIYDYVHFHTVPGPDTILDGVRRLQPGHYLRLRDGHATVAAYWEIRFEERSRRPFAELQSEFLASLGESVRGAILPGETGAFLSGGTDSSTIAGMLGRSGFGRAKTFSIGFAADGYDETAYARIAAGHFGTDHHEHFVTAEDTVAAIPLLAGTFDQPFGNSSAVPAYYCARLARAHGLRRLLAGDGGDELFGGNDRYARQQVFDYYSRLPASLRKLLIEPLVSALPSTDKITLLRRARHYVERASIPLPARLDIYNLLEHFGPTSVFTGDFLGTVDRRRPLTLISDVYQRAQAGSLINRMLATDLQFTLADYDLPKVVRTSELAQIDVAFPLLDDRVVSFSATLEPHLKLRGTTLRPFFKAALHDVLPEAIRRKPKHGLELPFGLWFQHHRPLRELVRGSLANLSTRGFIRKDFIENLTDVRFAERPDYYGVMVWSLMMLEHWLQRNSDR